MYIHIAYDIGKNYSNPGGDQTRSRVVCQNRLTRAAMLLLSCLNITNNFYNFGLFASDVFNLLLKSYIFYK